MTERYLTTRHIENQMQRQQVIIENYKGQIASAENMLRHEQQVIDLTDFNQMIIAKAKDNLQKFGRQLLMKTKVDMDEFNMKCDEYKNAIDLKPKDIDSLKSILVMIALVRTDSNIVQKKLYEIRERVRTFFQ